ncbi:MAG: hypothetical protein FJX03_02080 [Alphaproteobacteria bacterium]|nr:hypothetical protein [Alphaproteobacteria bacterium]
MESLAVLTLLKLLENGYGDSSLHPSLTYQSTLTSQERRDELYGEVDRSFQHLPGYQSALITHSQGDFPLGVFERPLAVDDKIGDGVLSNYLQGAIRGFIENLQAKGATWYAENVTPLDRTLIKLCVQGYGLAIAQRKVMLGQFNIEQGDFLGKLNAQNYLGALLQAFDLARLGFDRLRGYVIRTEALRQAPLISMVDKVKIQGAMDIALKRSEEELKFWMIRTLSLLKLTDLLHYLDDINETLVYQEETGGPNRGFQNALERYNIQSLIIELQAAFYNETRRQRLYVSFIFRAFEYIANPLGAYLAQGVGAKQPRTFPLVAEEASARITQEYRDLSDYREVKILSETDKAVKYLEAVARGRFLLGKQILVNWQHIPNKKFSSEQELRKLDTYKKFLEQLRWLQTQLFVLEYHVALKLKENRDVALENYADKIRQAIATLNYDHKELTASFLMDVQNSIKALHPNLAQLKTTFTDMLRRILLRGSLVESTSSFDVVAKRVTQRNQEYCEITKQVHDLLWGGLPVPENADVIDSHQDVEGEALPNPALLNPAKVGVFNAWALHAFKKFETPQRYLAFVEDPQFESLIKIDVAVFFSDQDLEVQLVKWSWRQQKEDLIKYCEFSRRVDELASRLSLSSQDLILRLKLLLLESLRKQVRTDYSAYKSSISTSWFAPESYRNSMVLLGRSAARKYFRMSQGSFPLNNDVPHFRDPLFQADIEAQLNLEIIPSPIKNQGNDSDE